MSSTVEIGPHSVKQSINVTLSTQKLLLAMGLNGLLIRVAVTAGIPRLRSLWGIQMAMLVLNC